MATYGPVSHQDQDANHHYAMDFQNTHFNRQAVAPVVQPLRGGHHTDSLRYTPDQVNSQPLVPGDHADENIYARSLEHLAPASDGTERLPTNDSYHSISTYFEPLQKPTPTRQPLERNVRAIPWWWWWEIVAALLSVNSICLTIVILGRVNNMPLSEWNLPIQPNSLVSICTTVGKAAMMVPIASCVSQLKWRHFRQRGRPLSHLQLFDDASRGPWGAAMLLVRARNPSLLVWALAVVTVVGLGVEPSAQQILGFETRQTNLTNVTALIGVADAYTTKAFILSGSTLPDKRDALSALNHWPNPQLFVAEASLLSSVTGQLFQPYFDCPEPAETCTWDTFTTLGLCSNVTDVTERTPFNCTGNYTAAIAQSTSFNPQNNTVNCTYYIPYLGAESDWNDSPRPMTMVFSNDLNPDASPTTMLNADSVSDVTSGGADYRLIRFPNITWPSPSTPPTPQIYVNTMTWCVQTYRGVTASPRGLVAGSATVAAEMLYQAESVGSVTNFVNGRDNKTLYAIDSSILSYVNTLLTMNMGVPKLYTDKLENTLDLSQFLYSADIPAFGKALATTLTNQIRSGGVANSAGDNLNSTTVMGAATRVETYVSVRWGWLILPLAETILTAVLLAVSITLGRGQPLLKSSVLALLAYPLRGLEEEVLGAEDPQSGEELEKRAKGMVRQLAKDEKGWLGFIRT